MGQKVNPVGFRILTNHNWGSVWYYDKGYASKLIDDIKIRNFINESYSNSGISKVIIERPVEDKVTVVIHTSKPGVLIGKKGVDIEKIKKSVEKIANAEVNIKIVEVDKPDADASLIAQSIAKQIEKRVFYKRAMKKAIQSSERYDVKGIKIECSGRLGGAEIARSEKYKEGVLSLHTLRCDIEYALAEAHTTYGIIGVKVWLYKEPTKGKRKQN